MIEIKLHCFSHDQDEVHLLQKVIFGLHMEMI